MLHPCAPAALAAVAVFVWRRRRARGSGPAGKGSPGSDPTLNSYGGEVDTLLTSGRRPFGSISFSLVLPPHARKAPVRPAFGAAAGAAAGAAVAAVVAASSPKAGTPSSASMVDKDALSRWVAGICSKWDGGSFSPCTCLSMGTHGRCCVSLHACPHACSPGS